MIAALVSTIHLNLQVVSGEALMSLNVLEILV
jgi:hypothetical protein